MRQAERLYNAAQSAGNSARMNRINDIRYRYQNNIFRGNRGADANQNVSRRIYMYGLSNG